MLNSLIQKFGLSILSINEVEDSHSSTVYQCNLHSGESVFLKIPYTKIKFERELDAYQILKNQIPIPHMLDYWSGNEEYLGAF